MKSLVHCGLLSNIVYDFFVLNKKKSCGKNTILITINKGKKKIIKVSMIYYHAACLSEFYFLVTQIILWNLFVNVN